ncbi:M23 family metallopeptidase [Bacillus salipaludis]|uniref:M23 family metallopeptidase n=1 Tax=Bacillus salipaludis TaxID=2547811 RepID=UPI002E1E7CAF|nr:M23 family metallopeptidase [Bacillus salipaludis]
MDSIEPQQWGGQARTRQSCPFHFDQNAPFHLYMSKPFITSQQIKRVTDCNSGHPGKDFTFDGAHWSNAYMPYPNMDFGTPVYAMEPGTVLWVQEGKPLCINDPKCEPNSVAIQSADRVVTEYVHVTPWVKKGQQVNTGDFIATLAPSGNFNVQPGGKPLPHLHINRITTPGNSVCEHIFSCNWAIVGADFPSWYFNPFHHHHR